MKLLITSGGTKVKIDMVRHIGNMSSGNFGSKIAYEALRRGHEVVFLMAKGSKKPISVTIDDTDGIKSSIMKLFKSFMDRKYLKKLKIYEYDTFDQYVEKLNSKEINTNYVDAVVLAAAVSDFGVDNYVDGKIRSKDADMVIKLKPLEKVISTIRTKYPLSKLIGFKLLVNSTTSELILAAEKSISENQCSLVVANDLRDIKNNSHKITLVTKDDINVHQSSDTKFLASKVIHAIEKTIGHTK